ncbi:RNA polymerase sigma factor [Cohnella luojiensis]|uniref:RNA polymerase sigma factor n=1 Tax=Cohnella luojiensis TaxID=652876 RepID=A0A4Y8M4Z4_9BACL|nr:RNA polymerase sigma factor [Cohnella luojiensis]TFE29441.1 RNA polymerase sigma factor [Cohnella luojiensis]
MPFVDDKVNIALAEDSRKVERLQHTLKRYCLSLTESPWDAEDLAQDAWLKAINAISSFDHRNLEAYLLRIAKNTWIDHTRRKTTLTRILKAERPITLLPDNGIVEIELAFQALIKHLSPHQLAVFLLRDVFEYSIAETAGMLETTDGAIKAALHRARLMLPTVMNEIEKGLLPLPEDENLKTFLRILATAYHAGDMNTMIELIQRTEMEPSMAIGLFQSRRIRTATMARRSEDKAIVPRMSMAA